MNYPLDGGIVEQIYSLRGYSWHGNAISPVTLHRAERVVFYGVKSSRSLTRMPAPIVSPSAPPARRQARALPAISADWLATFAALALAALAWSGLLPHIGW